MMRRFPTAVSGPKLSVIFLTSLLMCLLVVFTGKAKAATMQLNADDVSNIYFPFIEPKSEKVNWTEDLGYRHGEPGSDHFGSDYFAEDWNIGRVTPEGEYVSLGSKDCNEDFNAPISGEIIFSGESSVIPEYGNQVIIRSNIDSNFAFRIAHLNANETTVGDIVQVGDKLGEIGTTGNSTGCHAHIALYKDLENTDITRLKTGSTAQGLDHAAEFVFDADTVDSCPENFYFGEFFNNRNLEGDPKISACFSEIKFDWKADSPFPNVIDKEEFSVRWTTNVLTRYGLYEITTISDDGVRVYADGNIILDNWTEHAQTTDTERVILDNGNHEIVIEYFEAFDHAQIEYSFELFSPLNHNPEIIPAIPDQTIDYGDEFTTFDLDAHEYDVDLGDIDNLYWTITGNNQLTVNVDTDNVVEILYPEGFAGSENITFWLRDGYLGVDTQTVEFRVEEKVPSLTLGLHLPKDVHQTSITTLNDGRILMAGGYSTSVAGYLNESYIYDPATNTWSEPTPMVYERRGHTATKLNDGRVLVVAGYKGGHIGTAEIYDPVSDVWSSAGNLTVPRYSHTASLLPDGRVMIVGGFAQGSYDAPTEIYDPSTNTWSLGLKPSVGRGEHTATTLPDGRIMITGGYRGSVVSTVEIYNPTTSIWSTVANMNRVRTRHTATLLPDGKLMVAGGWNGTMLNTAEVYNPLTNSWSFTSNIPTPRSDHSAEYVNDKVIIIGGATNNSILTSSNYAYDVSTNTWSALPNLITPMIFHRTVIMNGDEIGIFGGFNSSSQSIDQLQILTGI